MTTATPNPRDTAANFTFFFSHYSQPDKVLSSTISRKNLSRRLRDTQLTLAEARMRSCVQEATDGIAALMHSALISRDIQMQTDRNLSWCASAVLTILVAKLGIIEAERKTAANGGIYADIVRLEEDGKIHMRGRFVARGNLPKLLDQLKMSDRRPHASRTGDGTSSSLTTDLVTICSSSTIH